MTIEEFADLSSDRPNAARMYDYYLGGYHNFAIDRQAAEQIVAAVPLARETAVANRQFLGRAVSYLAEQGIDQFLDLGSGLPTVGSVHEVARSVNPHAHVVYVDIDPVAVTFSARIIGDTPGLAVLQADATDAAAVLTSSVVRDHLDLSRPIGLLTVALLHFVPDDERALQMLASYHAAFSPGSYLVLCHGSDDFSTPEERARSQAIYARSSAPVRPRSHAGVSALFAGWSTLPPGVVEVSRWRPDAGLLPQERPMPAYAGVAQKIAE